LSDPRFYEEGGGAARRHAPAAARNVDPISAVLAEWLPQTGTVLEVASGTGEHVIAFARRFAHLQWQPSDVHPEALASIAAWIEAEGAANVASPLVIDAADETWPAARAAAVLAINMVHISPWPSSLGLLDGASRLLGDGAPLIVYGPWIERGIAPAASNIAFDEDLRSRDPRWGLREVEAFAAEAERRGLELVERRVMPANNLMLLFRRRG
jgi:hypothetical protein